MIERQFLRLVGFEHYNLVAKDLSFIFAKSFFLEILVPARAIARQWQDKAGQLYPAMHRPSIENSISSSETSYPATNKQEVKLHFTVIR